MTPRPRALRLRPLAPEDGETVARLAAALGREEGCAAECRLTAAIYRRDGFGPRPAFAGVIAELGGVPVGYALHCPDYDTDRLCRTQYLADLFVEKAARQGGIGRALLAAAARYAGAQGAQAMGWTALRTNRVAHRFYSRFARARDDQIVFGTTVPQFERLCIDDRTKQRDERSAAVIRTAGIGDVGRLADMLRDLQLHLDQRMPAAMAESLRRDGFGPAPAFEALIAEAANAPVGYALYWPTYDTEMAARGVWLSDLYVAPAARGGGLGRRLLGEMARRAAAFGGRYATWLVDADNHAALAFYRTVATESSDVVYFLCADDDFARLAAAPTGPR